MTRTKASPAPQTAMTMRRALSDPALLGKVLAGDSWRAWRILLIATMGEALDDEERAIFQRLTGRPQEPGERLEELWAVVGRRGGKSRAIAVLCVFIAVFVDHSSVLVVGERPVVLCLAPSQKQAGVVFGYVGGDLRNDADVGEARQEPRRRKSWRSRTGSKSRSERLPSATSAA